MTVPWSAHYVSSSTNFVKKSTAFLQISAQTPHDPTPSPFFSQKCWKEQVIRHSFWPSEPPKSPVNVNVSLRLHVVPVRTAYCPHFSSLKYLVLSVIAVPLLKCPIRHGVTKERQYPSRDFSLICYAHVCLAGEIQYPLPLYPPKWPQLLAQIDNTHLGALIRMQDFLEFGLCQCSINT